MTYYPKSPEGDDDDEKDTRPLHPETDFFLDQFTEHGIGTLGDRGVPNPTAFLDAARMMHVHEPEGQVLLLSIFRASASGLASAIEKDRKDRKK